MAENYEIKQSKRFSLIELLMIIMLVGIVFTFYVPLKADKQYREKTKEAIFNLQKLAIANVQYKNDPERGDGDYAIIIDELEPKRRLNLKMDYFTYEVTDTTIVCTTTKEFGKEGAVMFYYLPTGPFTVANDDLSKKTINPNWLP